MLGMGRTWVCCHVKVVTEVKYVGHICGIFAAYLRVFQREGIRIPRVIAVLLEGKIGHASK